MYKAHRNEINSTYSTNKINQILKNLCRNVVRSGARNVIPLIVHITHFYYYKSI